MASSGNMTVTVSHTSTSATGASTSSTATVVVPLRQQEVRVAPQHRRMVYVGSGFLGGFPSAGDTPSEDGAIHSFVLGEDGSLDPLEVIKQKGSFPMWLAADADHRHLYVVEAPSGDPSVECWTVPGFVHAYRIERDGRLTHLNRVGSGGAVPCHLAVVGRTVIASNFVGGSVTTLQINGDGSLQPLVPGSVHQHTPHAPTLPRQDAAHPHMACLDPAGKFAFVCDLGCNSIIGYTLDAAAATLARHSELILHDGAGPRHMAFSPVAPYAYCVNEIDNTVAVMRYDAQAGELTLLGALTTSALAPGTEHASGGGGAELTISNDGRFAYVSVRCTGAFNASEAAVFNSIAVLSLDAGTGACKLVQTVDSGGSMP